MYKSFKSVIICKACHLDLITPSTYSEDEHFYNFKYHVDMFVHKNLVMKNDSIGFKTNIFCKGCNQYIGLFYSIGPSSNFQMILVKRRIQFKSCVFRIEKQIAQYSYKISGKQQVIEGNREVIDKLQKDFFQNSMSLIKMHERVEKINVELEQKFDKLNKILSMINKESELKK